MIATIINIIGIVASAFLLSAAHELAQIGRPERRHLHWSEHVSEIQVGISIGLHVPSGDEIGR